jgi:UDP-N-acetyl-D-mannosaminuronate dehydrogenase
VSDKVIVVGLGEVGHPLKEILGRTYSVVGVDIQPVEIAGPCSVLHLCFPFHLTNFVGEAVRYMRMYRPSLTIINSTVVPGTTRKVHEASGGMSVAFSPVRGKHVKMEQDMMKYAKFVAGCDVAATDAAEKHFAAAGMKTRRFESAEAGEVAKLLETTYLGVLVGWAQEVERIAGLYGATHADMNSFIDEIEFLPSTVFPGVVGGHCVMANITLLRTVLESKYLDAIIESNEAKKTRSQEQVMAVSK